jgi:hypothetical protein
VSLAAFSVLVSAHLTLPSRIQDCAPEPAFGITRGAYGGKRRIIGSAPYQAWSVTAHSLVAMLLARLGFLVHGDGLEASL